MMKLITIDKVEYVKKEDYDLLKEKIKKQNSNKSGFPCFEKQELNLMDQCKVMGVGNVELKGSWNIVRISINYLKKAIKMVELLDNESVVLAVGKDYPLCLGAIKDNTFSGVIVAPRVED